ncbi:MAG TPA: hypothetical protein VF914_08285 [Chloroflexia bacterium]|jgi:antitoxin component of MazEF toxin-antitoxin module
MEAAKATARVVRQGEDWVILIDQSLLQEMQITDETTLNVSTDGSTLVLAREQDEARRAAFLASIEKMDQRYSAVFKRLAE